MTTSQAAIELIRVLCVDDSASIIALLKAILSPKFGFTVVGVAENGSVAVQMVKDLKPDVVTLDIHMPEMDGVSYMENHFKKGSHPPVVIISSVAREETELTQRAIAAGASDYVEKPAFNNLNKHSEEIRQKVQMAHVAARSDHVHQSFDHDCGTNVSAIADKLARVIVVSAGDESRLPLIFTQVHGDQPPTIVLIDAVGDVFERAASKVFAGRFKNLGVIKDPGTLEINEVGVMPFSSGWSLAQKNLILRTVCVCVLGVPSNETVNSVERWDGILLIVEDMDSSGPSSYLSLKKIAKDCMPIHSMGYMSLKLAS